MPTSPVLALNGRERTTTCQACAHEFVTIRANAKFCHLCRLRRDVIFLDKQRGSFKACKGCGERYARLHASDHYCARCDVVREVAGECEWCAELVPNLLHDTIHICLSCAKNPRDRPDLIYTLTMRQRRRQEDAEPAQDNSPVVTVPAAQEARESVAAPQEPQGPTTADWQAFSSSISALKFGHASLAGVDLEELARQLAAFPDEVRQPPGQAVAHLEHLRAHPTDELRDGWLAKSKADAERLEREKRELDAAEFRASMAAPDPD